MNAKKIALIFFVAFAGAASALYVNSFFEEPKQVVIQKNVVDTPASFTRYGGNLASALDFTGAAEKSLAGVVHVKTMSVQQRRPMSAFEFYFGNPYGRQQERAVMGTGSGVIISKDGYIVTNNHVIEGSREIEVTLDDSRSFKAKLIGTDPTTDIALLKIEGENLPIIPWGDSDKIKVGEWVLAVGNPFNLTSTVTAGIVSAKGRDINIIDKNLAIESFIQTDAAVNPGNSGGALVNTAGELVGINTAIASKDGSFTGYSFAVPTAIAKKVVEDIMEFGQVQRALLGINSVTMDSEVAKKLDIEMQTGVLVYGLLEGGAAEQAGIDKYDVVTKINGNKVKKGSELVEQVGRHRPGDEITVTVNRNGKEKVFKVVLQNSYGNTKLIKNDALSVLGAELVKVSDRDRARLGIRAGMQVKSISDGKLKRAGVQEGYIIVKMGNQLINSMEDVQKAIESAGGGVMIKGVYPNGVVSYYAFGLEE